MVLAGFTVYGPRWHGTKVTGSSVDRNLLQISLTEATAAALSRTILRVALDKAKRNSTRPAVTPMSAGTSDQRCE